MRHLPKQRQLVSQFYVTGLGGTDLTHALFCCPACHQGLVIIQDVSGNRTNCYEIIIAMNLKRIGWRNYCWEYLPETPHAKSFPWASCQEHILSTNCHLHCFFSAVNQIPVCSCSCGGFCNKLHTYSFTTCLLPVAISVSSRHHPACAKWVILVCTFTWGHYLTLSAGV